MTRKIQHFLFIKVSNNKEPATSEPAAGSLTPRHAILSPRIDGAKNSPFKRSEPNSANAGVAISDWTEYYEDDSIVKFW
jgi:hypothetical protein